jgi:hypothetical protein
MSIFNFQIIMEDQLEHTQTIEQGIHGSTGTVLLNEMTRNASIENDA